MNPSRARPLSHFLMVLFLTGVVFVLGCGLGRRATYLQYSWGGEDTKIRQTVTATLEAWGRGDFTSAYGYMTGSYREKYSLVDFLERRQHIDALLGAPAVSFAVTQVHIDSDEPQLADALIVYRSTNGSTVRDIASLRRFRDGQWRIYAWWAKGAGLQE